MSKFTDFIKDRYMGGGSDLDLGNIAKDVGVAGALYGIVNPNDSSGLASFFGTGGRQQPVGYTGGIPNYTATRELAPNAFAQTYTTPTGEVAPRRPGGAGRRYFTDTTFTQSTDTPFMGITAEQIAAQNQAAQDELDFFESLLGSAATQREAAAEQAAQTTDDTTAGQTAFGTYTGNAESPYGWSADQLVNYFNQGLTPEDIVGSVEGFGAVQPGTMAYDSLVKDYEYWQQNRANTTATDATTTFPSGIEGNGVVSNSVLDGTLGEVVGDTTTTIADVTDYLVDLGFGGEGKAPTSADIDDFITSGFELDTILDTLGVDTNEEKVAVASLAKNPFARVNILDDAVDTNFNSAALAAQEASKNLGGNPFASLFKPNLSAVSAEGGFSQDEQDYVANMINTGAANIADVAEKFEGVSQLDVIEGLLRGGYQAPEQITTTLNAVDPNTEFTEEQLIAKLLETNKTNPEEVAAYYGLPVSAVTARYRELGGTKFARGGDVNSYYLGGPTDGMADQIPATINNMEPARLSDGEFVIPADVVSHLGNGNSDAGAENLYGMMERVRKDRTGNPKQGKQIDPNKYLA